MAAPPGIDALMLLLDPSLVAQRRAVAAGPLAPLAASLAADLDRLLPDEDVFVPREKAKMTRRGGRCVRDGAFLEFDPRTPRRHRCPVCGSLHDDESHYRWWVMGYQLWLAERAAHAALLWQLAGTARHRRLAESILGRLASQYGDYPNEDNVLGPTRVFFSTYLESIWLLQLAVALSILEQDGASTLGGTVRDRIIEPSSALIQSFNEGESNRQVWNAAALAAAGLMLERPALTEQAFVGPAGLLRHLRSGLLGDGTWYEGENYHLFAHRGLWYLMGMARTAHVQIEQSLVDRFDRGFTAPLMTALPDLTFPSRRDSQYKASLRQWRIAESLELGLSRTPAAAELAAGLQALYTSGVTGDAARWRSTGEAERNVPGVRLTRADLGWKSLLFALPVLPPATPSAPHSVLLADQGLGIIRRDEGRTWVALDYGASGGSHGHPDRLNLWLVRGDQRIFEDVGTGSYVDPSLHWYRSTLAHNAPLVDGRSQQPTSGRLRAWDAQPSAAWIDAEAEVWPGVLVRRSVVVGEGHVVDRIEWSATRQVTIDLPMHIEATLVGANWESRPLTGASGLEDGFSFIGSAECAGPIPIAHPSADDVHGLVHCDAPHEWWRGIAPGPPGEGPRQFLILRSTGSAGCITSAWSWIGPIEGGPEGNGRFAVTVSGTRSAHALVNGTWAIERDGNVVTLSGHRGRTPDHQPVTVPVVSVEATALRALRHPPRDVGDLTAGGAPAALFALGEAQYRRTEQPWADSGAPTATVAIGATTADLLVEVTVNNVQPNFARPADENPLDNEHPDINSDGVQIHLQFGFPNRATSASWLLVPQPSSGDVRVTGRDGAVAVPLSASWRSIPGGWQLLARIARASLGAPGAPFALDAIVNDMPPGRERRRGQLVLSGGRSEWGYLRGDRQDPSRYLPMVVRGG